MKKILTLTAALAVLATTSYAQRGGSTQYKINKVAPEVVQTPEFQFTGKAKPAGAPGKWLEVEVQFEAKPKYTDELTFKYYILLSGKLLVGEVSHVNIQEGKSFSVMYVSPRAISQVLDGKVLTGGVIENIAVQMISKGQLLAEESFKPGRPQWWMQMQQIPGLVLNKNETPFMPLYWDRYEAIKAPTR